MEWLVFVSIIYENRQQKAMTFIKKNAGAQPTAGQHCLVSPLDTPSVFPHNYNSV
jgi:hypothetical protein